MYVFHNLGYDIHESDTCSVKNSVRLTSVAKNNEGFVTREKAYHSPNITRILSRRKREFGKKSLAKTSRHFGSLNKLEERLSIDSLCATADGCQWKRPVVVNDRYIYIIEKSNNIILLIDHFLAVKRKVSPKFQLKFTTLAHSFSREIDFFK